MDVVPLADLAAALAVLGQPGVLLWLLAGVLAGFVFGAAPGLTATTGVAIATPLTFGASFEQSMALLLGLYAAGYFAGSIPAILINTPGAPGNAATALDGYRLARAGRADLALGLAIGGSAIGGILSLLVLMVAAPNLASFALAFTSVEYFALGLFGLVCVAGISGGSVIKGMIGAVLGMTLGAVGIDEVGGTMRFTMGLPELQGGIPLIPALIALFAVTEILLQSAGRQGGERLPVQARQPLGELLAILARNGWLTVKSAGIGTVIGILPGTGPTIASWVAYSQRGRSRGDDAEGRDRIRGVLAAESANNAVTGGALVPLLTLGIPGDTVTAVLIGALLIQGIDPGPFFIFENGPLFAQILLLLLLSNLLIVIIGLGARRVLPRILEIPERILLPVVAVLCAAGGFAINHAPFEVGLIAVLGAFGYLLVRFGVPMAPVVLGLVLGPIIEVNLRNGLIANDLDPLVFVTRPISAALLITMVMMLAGIAWRHAQVARGHRS